MKSKYSAHNEERRFFINDIPSEEPSFEAMTSYSKTFSKFIKEDENMSLKSKCLMALKVYRLVILHVQNKKAGANKL